MMRRFRICYYAVMGFAFLLGKITGERVFFVLAAAMIMLVLFALALVLWTIFSFSYIQNISEQKTVKGQEIQLHIEIHNERPFPFPMMQIEAAQVAAAQRIRLKFSLASHDRVTFELPIPCVYRGVYRVGMTRLEVSDVFGLVRIPFYLERLPYYRRPELFVYPRVLDLPYIKSAARDAKVRSGRPHLVSDGDNQSELRDYQRGDTMKRIHWKQSARQHKLIVKQYEMPLESGILIAVDAGVHGLTGDRARQYEDLICECAVSIAGYCQNNGYRVQLIDSWPAHPAVSSDGMYQLERMKERLASLEFTCTSSLAERILQEIKPGSDLEAVYLLTGRKPEDVHHELNQLQQKGIQAKAVMLPQQGIRDAGQLQRILEEAVC